MKRSTTRRPRADTRFVVQPTRSAVCAVLFAVLSAALPVPGRGEPSSATSFADFSLEELMNETVTSVSKREQRLADVAAAITVFSNDDLQRSGATSIADALRLVPGMVVGSLNSRQWAVSARGFNGVHANKLLVLIDGRSVYSPVFAGVYWDLQQTILEDVDRVEVIRGPGATIWGANAVNGVVNIVSRSARDTQGGLLYSSGGDVQQAGGGVRYGGRLGENTYYRVYASGMSKDDYPLANGDPSNDGWQAQHGGVRIDHHPDEQTHLMWQAGTSVVNTDNQNNGGSNLHTLGRITRRFSERSGVEVQAYYDQIRREQSVYPSSRADTIDLTAEHTFGVGERNDIIWGVGYRQFDIELEETSPLITLRDEEVESEIFSLFVQDEFRLVPDKVTLTGGVKLEHNDFTGFEVQPSIRAVYKPTSKQTLWAAVSRAVRTPAASEGNDTMGIVLGGPFFDSGGFYIPRLVGNRELKSEVLMAYELGYRIQPTSGTSVDVAVFCNDYSDLASIESISRLVPGAPFGTAEVPWVNSLEGKTYGAEVSVGVNVTDAWRLTVTYTLLMADIQTPIGDLPNTSPRNQATLLSTYAFNSRLSLDAQFRYVDTIFGVPAYLTADLRITYRISDRLEFSLVGQNLLDRRHPEQAPGFFEEQTEVPRGFYGKLTWRF